MLYVLCTLGGLALVLLSAQWLVDGASATAKRLRIPDIVIGLTIVAFGTSSPELITNLLSVQNGHPEIAVGNILGSNIANIFFILGVSAMIYPLPLNRGTVWKEVPLCLLAGLIVFVVANDRLFDNAATDLISRTDGLLLLGFFCIFLVYTYEISRDAPDETAAIKPLSPVFAAGLVVAGLIGLFFGGKFFVDGATGLAKQMGVSDRIIALTVVSIGTSLPELATSITAALRRQADIAVGNAIGSNIFNIFFILGFTATVHPLPYQAENSNIDALLGITGCIFLFFSVRIFTKGKVGHVEGVIFAAVYAAYLIYLIASA